MNDGNVGALSSGYTTSFEWNDGGVAPANINFSFQARVHVSSQITNDVKLVFLDDEISR